MPRLQGREASRESNQYVNMRVSLLRGLRASSSPLTVTPTYRYLQKYSTMVERLADLPSIEKLSPRVLRILGGNPSKVRHASNTLL